MAVATKAAVFCVLVRFFDVALGPAADDWQPALAALATVSIVVGNVGALGQHSLKRLLGYSGVAQAGYMMVGVVAASAAGVSALVFYLAAYTLMNLAAFAVITIRERETALRRRHPLGRGARPRAAGARGGADDLDARARRPPGHRGLHRQALPDRGHGRGRLHLARRDDRDRDDDLARLLPAGDRGGLDAPGRRAGRRSAMPAMAGGSQEADARDHRRPLQGDPRARGRWSRRRRSSSASSPRRWSTGRPRPGLDRRLLASATCASSCRLLAESTLRWEFARGAALARAEVGRSESP